MRTFPWIVLLQKEISDAYRSRWFIAFAVVFALLILGFTATGVSAASAYGVTGFGRTAAGLINLILLMVPLIGLLFGALSLSSEREKGILLYLYSHPVTHAEIFWGKFLGLGTALVLSLMLGFGFSGAILSLRPGMMEVPVFISLFLLSTLLLALGLSMGLFISCLVRRTTTAVCFALFVWLFLVFFSDLGIMGTASFFRLPIQGFLFLSFLNPLQVVKIASVLAVQGNLEILGPSGLYAERLMGDSLIFVLPGIVLFWIAVLLILAPIVLKKRGVLA